MSHESLLHLLCRPFIGRIMRLPRPFVRLSVCSLVLYIEGF